MKPKVIYICISNKTYDKIYLWSAKFAATSKPYDHLIINQCFNETKTMFKSELAHRNILNKTD